MSRNWIKKTYSNFGKKLGHPIFNYKVDRDAKKYSKPIQDLLHYYKNNLGELEDISFKARKLVKENKIR